MSKGLTQQEMQSLVSEYRINEKDSGSPEVQVAVLSKRIAGLTTHAQTHKKDHHTRLGLQKMVAKQPEARYQIPLAVSVPLRRFCQGGTASSCNGTVARPGSPNGTVPRPGGSGNSGVRPSLGSIPGLIDY